MGPNLLLKRLDAIGQSLSQSGHVLALIGLCSVGVELDRLDEFSDSEIAASIRSLCAEEKPE